MHTITNTSAHTAFSSTAADPLLIFRMTPNGNHMLRLLTHSSQLIAFIFLPLSLITVIDPSLPLRMTFNVSRTTTADPLLLFRMTPNGNHMLRLLTHSSQLIAFIFLPLSLITVTDSSLPLRMTFNVLCHYDA